MDKSYFRKGHRKLKGIIVMACVAGVALPAAAGFSGRVYVDKNSNGVFDRGEKTLAGIAVSDGLNVVETGRDGSFTLPGHESARFIFVTLPSGYKAPAGFYRPVDATVSDGYDFGLVAQPEVVASDGSHSFIQITDTEIFNTTKEDDWADAIRDYSDNSNVAFIIHTGDICYENGLKNHIRLMNTANMGRQMHYCIGNHDLVKGKYGEELYESVYGPVWYSFDAGNVHYIVTPMAGGDHMPSYRQADVYAWLKNDLAHVEPSTPVICFNHDLISYDGNFTYRGKDGDSIRLNDHNLKAWVYGHWHNNFILPMGDVLTINSSTPDKGGIDHSTAAYRVIKVDGKGNVTSQLRYPYVAPRVTIASPASTAAIGTVPVAVNAYSSTGETRSVTATLLCDGKTVASAVTLRQSTDWSWNGSIHISEAYAGRMLTLKATAVFEDGDRVSSISTFTAASTVARPEFGADWDNLVGNASHTGVPDKALDTPLALSWVSNVGANIYMTSPLINNGKIYTASVDEELRGDSHIYALDGMTGKIVWSYATRNSVKNSIAITSGVVFAQDVEGWLYAVDAETGTLRWETKMRTDVLPALIDGLVAADGIVYAGSGKGLGAWDAATGRNLWTNNDWSQNQGATSTISVADGIVVHGTQWGALYGNDAATGKMLWSASDADLRMRGCSPAIRNGLIYMASAGTFYILEAATGKAVVKHKLGFNADVTSTPLVTDKLIIFGTVSRGLVALDRTTLQEKWCYTTDNALIFTSPYSRSAASTIETSPVLAGNTVYVGASDGNLYGIDVESGRMIWRRTLGAPVFSTVAISGNALAASDFGGNVYLFTSAR